MEFNETGTKKTLGDRIIAELYGSFLYNMLAEKAKLLGQFGVEEICLATSKNKMEHAVNCYEALGGVDDIEEGLMKAQALERSEAGTVYPDAARTARREDLHDAADLFDHIEQGGLVHERLLAQVLLAVRQGEPLPGRTVGRSATRMAQTMQPSQANPAGNVHGGELMKLMDDAAGATASLHSQSHTVTACVDGIKFIAPVKVGDIVFLEARVLFASRSSMIIRVDLEAENPLTAERVSCNTADFTMVAMGSDGKPCSVPPLIVCTEEEQRLFNEARSLYEEKKSDRRLLATIAEEDGSANPPVSAI